MAGLFEHLQSSNPVNLSEVDKGESFQSTSSCIVHRSASSLRAQRIWGLTLTNDQHTMQCFGAWILWAARECVRPKCRPLTVLCVQRSLLTHACQPDSLYLAQNTMVLQYRLTKLLASPNHRYLRCTEIEKCSVLPIVAFIKWVNNYYYCYWTAPSTQAASSRGSH